MSRLGVQNPITAGQIIGSYNASSVNDTDWHNLTSDEFYNVQTGTQITDGLKFAYVAIITNASDLSYLKLRAAAGAGDSKSNTAGVIPVFGGFDIDAQALNTQVTAIAYAKAAGTDKTVIYAGFNL